MSNWQERIANAFSTRRTLDAEEERSHEGQVQRRKESEDRGKKLRKERLDTYKMKVNPELAKSALAKAREVWRVGKISEKVPDGERLKWVFHLVHSRRGSASCVIHRSMEYGNTWGMCRGVWIDSLTIGFSLRDDGDVNIQINDGHHFEGEHEAQDGEWRSHGKSMILKAAEGSRERVLIEEFVLELCEQRILNKQLPLDYRY